MPRIEYLFAISSISLLLIFIYLSVVVVVLFLSILSCSMLDTPLPCLKAGDSWFNEHCAATIAASTYTFSPSVTSRLSNGSLDSFMTRFPVLYAGYFSRRSRPGYALHRISGKSMHGRRDSWFFRFGSRTRSKSDWTGRRFRLSIRFRHASPPYIPSPKGRGFTALLIK